MRESTAIASQLATRASDRYRAGCFFTAPRNPDSAERPRLRRHYCGYLLWILSTSRCTTQSLELVVTAYVLLLGDLGEGGHDGQRICCPRGFAKPCMLAINLNPMEPSSDAAGFLARASFRIPRYNDGESGYEDVQVRLTYKSVGGAKCTVRNLGVRSRTRAPVLASPWIAVFDDTRGGISARATDNRCSSPCFECTEVCRQNRGPVIRHAGMLTLLPPLSYRCSSGTVQERDIGLK